MNQNIKLRTVLILLGVCLATLVQAQKSQQLVRKGNSAYEAGKFKEAEIDYRKAISTNPNQINGLFNLGNSLYRQKNFSQASEAYLNLGKNPLMKKTSPYNLAKTFHNLGNSLLEDKKYQESIKSYENALKINPKDDDTRYNLVYALNKLKQQQEQNKKNQQNNQNNQQKNQQNQEKQEPKQQDKQNQQMNKQNAEQMLNAMNNNEKLTLEKLNKKKVENSQVKVEKDW